MTPGDIIKNKRLVVACGSGGVGKTTTSAAMALEAAANGRKTLVITIDPARRLAQSLGLDGLDNEERRVPADFLAKAGLPADTELYAAMLDTAASLDALIRRIAKTPEQSERILENKIYRQFTRAIAGSQEYVAMERLYDLMQRGVYDLVILDTPPTKNALDFLHAPDRLAAFMDEGVVKWFVRPRKRGVGSLIFQKSGEVVFKLLGYLVGQEFIQDLMDFFQAFNGLYEGFRGRATKVQQLLRDSGTVFVLVTAVEQNAMGEAAFFHNKLAEAGIPLENVVVNRAYHLIGDADVNADALAAELLENAEVSSSLEGEDKALAAERLAKKLIEQIEIHRSLNRTARENITHLKGNLTGARDISCIPIFVDDIHDLDGLLEMNKYLFAAEQPCSGPVSI